MRNFIIYIFFLSSLGAISCSKKDGTKPITEPPGSNLPAETKMNVSYGIADPLQKMDVYLPAKRTATSTKVLFLIHGGAWTEGDKNDIEYKTVVDTLKKRLPEWAIINLNYRLASIGSNLFPTQENDIKEAINFTNNNRTTYAISDKWVYVGASAGGHLALLQAYKNNTTIKPKAVVNYFGPSDLAAMISNPGADSPPVISLQYLFNGTTTASSPINFITAQSPPTISLQGANDQLVLPSQQTALHAN